MLVSKPFILPASLKIVEVFLDLEADVMRAFSMKPARGVLWGDNAYFLRSGRRAEAAATRKTFLRLAKKLTDPDLVSFRDALKGRLFAAPSDTPGRFSFWVAARLVRAQESLSEGLPFWSGQINLGATHNPALTDRALSFVDARLEKWTLRPKPNTEAFLKTMKPSNTL